MKFLLIVFTNLIFAQNDSIFEKKLYFEVCNTFEISMCGNYFEQNLMRDPFLIEIDKFNFLKSYDTVYKLDYNLIKKVNNYIADFNKDKYINVIFPYRYYKNENRFLKKNKLREKPTNSFKFIPLFLKYKVKSIERDTICIVNPNFKKRNDDFFLIKNVLTVNISEIYIDDTYVFLEKDIYLKWNGDIIR